MSHFMDYGPHWPPATLSQKETVGRREAQLWQKALAWIVLFAVIWLAGAITLRILAPTGANLHFPTRVEPHTVYATTTAGHRR